jgi:polar amino acid transport system substrate-binding protein
LVLVALLAVFALIGAACGEDEPSGEGTDTGEETTSAPATTGGETTTPAETTPAIPEFETLEEGVLKVGSCLDYPPFEFIEGDEEKGFDVEISEEIAARLGLEVEWVVAPFDTIFVALNAGNFDMVAAATTITAERDEQVDFTDPYFNTRQALIINTETSGDIASVDDLKEGDTVAVLRGSTSETWAVENLEPRGIVLKAFRAVPPEFTDLEAGNVVAMLNDESQSVVEVPKRENLEIVEYIDTQEVYGLVFAGEGGDPLPGLRDAVNVVLHEMIADGTYAEIFTKYFPDNEVPPEFQPEG